MSPPGPYARLGARTRVHRWWLVVPFTCALLSAILALRVPGALALPGGLLEYLGLLGVVGASMLALLAWSRPVSGPLAVTAEGVYLAGRRIARLSRITQAVAFTSSRGPGVRISQGRHALPVTVEFDRDEDAKDLVLALDQDARNATASFPATVGGMRVQRRLVLQTVTSALAILGGIVGVNLAAPHLLHDLYAHHALVAWLTTVTLYLAFITTSAYRGALTTAELVVGADGILVKRAVGPSVFHRFDDVRDVQREGGDVTVTLASGETARYGIGGESRWEGETPAQTLTALLARIADARAAYASTGASEDLTARLLRGDRDVPTWRASLASLLAETTTYRTPAVPPETLWRVLEDPTQPATARAGAAVALRGTLDEETRVRLRVATATCASAELRGAFEATLAEEEDEEHVERALRAFGEGAR